MKSIRALAAGLWAMLLPLTGAWAGMRPGETDLRAGYRRAFERIGPILSRAGVSWDDVVDITSFHTDLTTQMPAMVAVKNLYIKPPFPTWTAVQLSRLIPDNGRSRARSTTGPIPSPP